MCASSWFISLGIIFFRTFSSSSTKIRWISSSVCWFVTRGGFKIYALICIEVGLEHLNTPDQRALVVSVLRLITLSLIKNNNGQHVIQQCLRYFSPEDNKQILNVVADNCLDVATDKNECCVLQQCLSHSAGELRDRFFAQIISNAHILSEHPYWY